MIMSLALAVCMGGIVGGINMTNSANIIMEILADFLSTIFISTFIILLFICWIKKLSLFSEDFGKRSTSKPATTVLVSEQLSDCKQLLTEIKQMLAEQKTHTQVIKQ